MRRFFSILIVAVTLMIFGVPASPQVSVNAPAQTPEALTALYNQSMQAKDWPRCRRGSRSNWSRSQTSSLHLKLLANAQLYSGLPDAALATYD